MNISQFNNKTFDNTSAYGFQIKPIIICNDGFTMSVQGSSGHYCAPRSIEKDYYSMEIGFPSIKEDLIMEWADNPQNPTESVYGWVPADVIDQVIIKHGGINQELTFKNN